MLSERGEINRAGEGGWGGERAAPKTFWVI